MKLFLSLALSFTLAPTLGHAAKPSQVVTMKSISFDPKVLTIAAGDSVTWRNSSYTDHSATADGEFGFDTGLVHPRHASKAIVFSRPGDFPYRCRIHGKTMSGTIQVRASQP